jgi:outer membrane protein OmpA-like peptidoglycan-associated protein
MLNKTSMKTKKMHFSKITTMLVIIGMLAGLSSCNKWSRTAKGGAIGAGAGAAVGAGVGAATGNTARGAIIGAVVGGTAGALIGRKMDKQAEELQKDLDNAKVERVGEGIQITFDSGILFDINSSDLKPAVRTELNKLAEVLKKYEDTDILIEGHTDNTGTAEYNMQLSVRRAQSVGNYLKQLGIRQTRLTETGYGITQPIADNSTAAGRTLNRRVEIAIIANEKMKKAAERGELD